MRIDGTFAKSCSTVGIETVDAADTWPDIFRFALGYFYPPVGICNKIAGHSHKIGSALQEKLFRLDSFFDGITRIVSLIQAEMLVNPTVWEKLDRRILTEFKDML